MSLRTRNTSGTVRSWLMRCALLGSVAMSLPLSTAAVGAGLDEETQTGLAEFALAAGDLPRAQFFVRNAAGNRAQFLRARLLADAGDTETARRLLEEIPDQHPDAGEAALVLARMAQQAGDDETARKQVNRSVKLADGDVRQQALFMDAELKRGAGNLDGAGAMLASMDEGYWAALGYLNIATEYARHDINASRAIISLRVALAMTKGDDDVDRMRELRSRILLKAGYLSYQQEHYDKAVGFLEKVPMETFATPQALYYHGLALSAQGDYRGAMQSWHRARKYPLAYGGVAGSWLGMGRGFDMAGYLGQAGEAFLAANAAYDKERVTLRQLAEDVEKKGAYEAFVRASGNEGVEWFLAENRTMTQPRQAYLLHFVETPGGQRRVRQMASLDTMNVRLDARESDLDAFRSVLRDRMTQSRGNEIGAGLPEVGGRIAALESRLDKLAARQASYAQTSRLADTRRRLEAMADRHARLGRGVTARNGYFAGLLEQTEQALGQVQKLQRQVANLRTQTEARLNEEVRAFITREDERIAFNQDRAEQQIAHLYEFLALESIDKGAK